MWCLLATLTMQAQKIDFDFQRKTGGEVIRLTIGQ